MLPSFDKKAQQLNLNFILHEKNLCQWLLTDWNLQRNKKFYSQTKSTIKTFDSQTKSARLQPSSPSLYINSQHSETQYVSLQCPDFSIFFFFPILQLGFSILFSFLQQSGGWVEKTLVWATVFSVFSTIQRKRMAQPQAQTSSAQKQRKSDVHHVKS